MLCHFEPIFRRNDSIFDKHERGSDLLNSRLLLLESVDLLLHSVRCVLLAVLSQQLPHQFQRFDLLVKSCWSILPDTASRSSGGRELAGVRTPCSFRFPSGSTRKDHAVIPVPTFVAVATAPVGSRALTGFHLQTCRCKATKDHAFTEHGGHTAKQLTRKRQMAFHQNGPRAHRRRTGILNSLENGCTEVTDDAGHQTNKRAREKQTQ